ncbi:MAG TPA: isoleucine--tRNA ligase, partial [Planctomycetota bacterium]|nr:isoleucine--tRNA ligase [Planctomycetota bacterium]
YGQVRAARAGAEKYTLHDGPPYASGELHIGTGMNKILKDIVVKYKTMRGYDAPFIPGWDCHGLPIEQKVQDEMLKKKEQWPKPEIRRRSEEFARKHIEGHRKQFKALGILGRWAEPYLTLNPKYEAGVIDVFGRLVEKGYVYRKRKPIHWCAADQTALAEAELEYAERSDPSVYLRFKLERGGFGLLVWTTTPWTLFGNVAVAVHPDEDYDLVEYARGEKREASYVASALRERVLAKIGASEAKVLSTTKGAKLEGLVYERPFLKPEIERAASVVTAPYVSMTDGTGLVHTAPGHGREDYETALRVGLPVVSPVDTAGKFTDEVPFEYRGQFVLKANDLVVENLRNEGILLHAEKIQHSYPHCWRCRGPLIFRATAQWFVGIDHEEKPGAGTLRARALETVRKDVKWFPDYGLSRIEGMLRDRPDWCVSRQRAWGIPIPAFYCEGCDEPLLTKKSCDRIRDLFGKEGANAWYTKSVAELLGEGFTCAKCGKAEFRKEDDIFDVWFESGSSWHSVIDVEPELHYPADLYLEGSDQHRGWFQLSLIPALGATGRAPFKSVDTHGFVVDDKGEKMSKSRGNYLSLEDGLKRYSGDILRLFFSSIDYWEDVRVSPALIEKMRDTYRKIRNTFKYLLGNLHDWPESAPDAEPDEIDRWALAALERVRKEVEQAYEELRFHKVYRAIHDFCAVELSTIYFEAVRDRLYCERPDDPRRRATQNALGTILSTLVRLLAPICVYTCEEIWDQMRAAPWGKGWLTESVHLAAWPKENSDAEEADWKRGEALLKVREEVYKAIEPLRKEKTIGEPTDAVVEVEAEGETLKTLEALGGAKLAELLVVADASVKPGAALKASVKRSPHPKCERCWVLRPSVKARPEAGGASLCDRCASVVAAM